MQKLIFLGIGLVLNLLEDAVGRLELARVHSDVMVQKNLFNNKD